jgi:hypothetical protein
MTSRSAAAATSGALIRNSAIAMLITALTVPFRRPSVVDRRSECSASTIAARASNAPIRDAGYSASPSGVASASSPSTSVTTASAVTRRRWVGVAAFVLGMPARIREPLDALVAIRAKSVLPPLTRGRG